MYSYQTGEMKTIAHIFYIGNDQGEKWIPTPIGGGGGGLFQP